MSTRIAEALRAVPSADAVVTDTETLETDAHDDAEWAPYGRALDPDGLLNPGKAFPAGKAISEGSA
jgi:FAD/FMN-containing dehydrogenase